MHISIGVSSKPDLSPPLEILFTSYYRPLEILFLRM